MADFELQFVGAGFENWLKVKPRQVKSAARKALGRVGTAVRDSARQLFRERGIGRSMFGPKPAGAAKIITKGKIRLRNGALELPITLKGLAAIQEKGGTLKAHTIEARNKRVLKMEGSGGTFFARSVQHKGAKYPAIPYAKRAAAMHSGRLREELDKELGAIFAKGAA